MTKHTKRDEIWHQAVQRAMNEESFSLNEIAEIDEINVSKRTVRDVLKTLVDLGWLAKDTPRSHEWHPGPIPLGEEVNSKDQDTTESSEITAHKNPKLRTDLSKGEVYFGKVDRISGPGNAIIQYPDDHLNLGKLNDSVVGETVKFEHTGGCFGRCLDDQYTPDGYDGPPSSGGSKKASNSSRSPSSEGPSSTAATDATEQSQGQATTRPTEPKLPPEPTDSDKTFVYYVDSSKANCYHTTRNCSALNKREGDLRCVEKDIGDKPPDEISHLRKCLKC